jgi:uncharacterized protein (DUF2141 family)
MKVILFVTVLFISMPVLAQITHCTVEGEILFDKTGDIYVYLVTEESFRTPFTGSQEKVIEVGEQELRKKVAAFKFEQVRAGNYGIRCFQDVDGDGKLERGLFGPKEPWGMSWQGKKPAKWPEFEDISFEVNSNITSIQIRLE